MFPVVVEQLIELERERGEQLIEQRGELEQHGELEQQVGDKVDVYPRSMAEVPVVKVH